MRRDELVNCPSEMNSISSSLDRKCNSSNTINEYSHKLMTKLARSAAEISPALRICLMEQEKQRPWSGENRDTGSENTEAPSPIADDLIAQNYTDYTFEDIKL